MNEERTGKCIRQVEEELEETKVAIRVRKSKKDRQHNGQTKKDRRTNNDQQNITKKTKDQATRTTLKRMAICDTYIP